MVMAGTLIAREPAQGARRGDDPRRRLGHRRAGRRARRRRPQRRGQVDAAAPARGPRPPRPRATVRLTAGTAGYLPQEPDRAPGETLQDYLARRTGVADADARVQAATADLATDAPGAADRYAEAFEAWLELGGADLEPRAETVLRDLGLDPRLLDLETVALSGGQAARASLAAILLSRFDVLLLDEPTNDLDFDGLARLERFVAERPGGAVIVSHDRAFLERTVTRVLEIDEIAHTAAEYGGGWAGYLELRATAARHAEERYETYTAQRDRLDRPRAHAAPVVGQRRAARPRRPRATSPTSRPPPLRRALGEAGVARSARPRRRSSGSTSSRSRGSAGSCSCASAAASAPATSPSASTAPSCAAAASRSARSTSSWPGASGSRSSAPTAPARRRWSTALLGDLRARAPARAGSAPGVRIGTLDQARAGFDGAGSADRRLRRAERRCRSRRRARCWPSSASSATRSRAPARSLSPGERTRASLALLMASGANWLVLDEPTNHLDLPGDRAARDRAGRLRRHAAAGHPRPRSCSTAVELDRTIDLGAATPDLTR